MHNITVARAMERIGQALHEDHAPGSYYHGWLANIAMPILDQHSLDLRSPEGANMMATILLEHFWPAVSGEKVRLMIAIDAEVVTDKQLRADLDEILQELKASNGSRPRSIAITKLQEAIMWLGMDLKELNEKRPPAERVPGPYPTSYDPTNPRVEPTADGLKL